MSEQHASVISHRSTASDLMARGFALFPLRPGTKVPAVPRDWEHAATTSPLRLRQLTPGPGANYGVACGPSDLVVVDLDVAKAGENAEGAENGAGAAEGATDGWRVLQDLAARHEGELPRTFTVSTPSGGRHLYFRPPVDGAAPRNTVRRLGPLIDTRGAGGYVVAPGSRVDGVEYQVIDDAPIAPLPDWISTLLRPMEERPLPGEPLSLASALGPVRAELGGAYARTALEREIARVAAARVGTRNDTLNRAAYNLGTLVGSGLLDRAEVEVELTRAARGAGLEAREVTATLRSGLTAGIARPRRLVGVGASAAASGVHQISLDDGAEAGRTLIPTHVPQPADWPRVFGRHIQLNMAATAVRRELAGQVPSFELPAMPALSPQGREAAPAALAEQLTELDDAYELAAQASGPIVGSAPWQEILALVDALRDLNDELIGVPEPLPAPILALIRSLTSVAARQVVALAKEIAVKLNADGLRHSPLWIGVRRMQRAAEAVADFGTPVSPLTPSRQAVGRGALQTQLNAMRRSIQSPARTRPTAAAS
ncbi:bifunctional DNA primase/polymerase [Actinospica sp.]|uniref:bifunctional DNA primase/polymerase n=1 Tax=Actinospica sp. TaxID=1872142 RepID=UPI002BB4FB4F|nr:bifunctional DNA primase/polymerase [Actinospica sp.]HWG24247.1 bifunctional DNA primase/polymerase [Actinospica sp.]